MMKRNVTRLQPADLVAIQITPPSAFLRGERI
jgi:hypothetical protein